MITEIILAILALLGNCGWFISGRKHREEIRQARAEAERSELDLSQEYVSSFRENIYQPLADELQKLRASIEKINICPYRADCPVARQLYEGARLPAAEPPGDDNA